MSGPLGGYLGVDTLAKQIGYVRVPKTVERDLSDAGLAHEIAKLTAQLVRWPEAAVHIRKHSFRLAEPEGHAFFGLVAPVFPRARPGRRSTDEETRYQEQREEFRQKILELRPALDFAPSSRGWCYILEEHGLTKGVFGGSIPPHGAAFSMT